jgi:hypothetical protein
MGYGGAVMGGGYGAYGNGYGVAGGGYYAPIYPMYNPGTVVHYGPVISKGGAY